MFVEALRAVRLDHPQVDVGGVGVPGDGHAQVALELLARPSFQPFAEVVGQLRARPPCGGSPPASCGRTPRGPRP